MKIAILTCDGVISCLSQFGDIRNTSCFVKKIRVMICDIKNKVIIDDRTFKISMEMDWNDVPIKVRNSWVACCHIHKCIWNCNGKKYQSVLRIIREIFLINNIKKIFSKGPLVERFLNKGGMYGETILYKEWKKLENIHNVIELKVRPFKTTNVANIRDLRCDYYYQHLINL